MPDGIDIAWSNHARQRWEERYGTIDAEDALADSEDITDAEARWLNLECRSGQWCRLSRKYGVVFTCGQGVRGDTLVITVLSRREKTEFRTDLKLSSPTDPEPVAEYWPPVEQPMTAKDKATDQDVEITAMSAIVAALKPLTDDQVVRVLRWIMDRYVDHPANGVAHA